MSALTAETLAQERTYLLGVAYRLLGSASDAEDVVQEALVRASNATDLRSPRAFLTTVVTRLCLDELGSARRRRETYVGPYLPEPLLTDALADGVEQRESVSLALLVVLDQLSPLERAVFVLRDLFDLEFSEIAQALERSEPACRKLLSRARERIESAQRAPTAPLPAQKQVANAFMTALATGDLAALVQLLADEATLNTDHGGKASAARKQLRGGDQIGRLLLGLAAKGAREPSRYEAVPCFLNGAPGLVLREVNGPILASFTLEITEATAAPCVSKIYAMRNPDKLVALSRALDSHTSLPTRITPATKTPA